MRKKLISTLMLPSIFTISAYTGSDERPEGIKSSLQMILVISEEWTAVDARLTRFERRTSSDSWTQTGPSVPVVVGQNGMAWGKGLYKLDKALSADQFKHEGDNKAPAGIFALGTSIGYASQAEASSLGIKLDYLALTPTIECVDDVNSQFYNQILDRSQVTVDWTSSEKMLRTDELYSWGVFVEHNSPNPVVGGGSCIFMHVWRGPSRGTAGCTAMEQTSIQALLGWMDRRKSPILVQLPRAEFEQRQILWQLPSPLF